MAQTRTKEESYYVASLAKGLRVLRALADADGGLSQSELADRLGLPLPTVFRLLKTLEAEGFVETDAGRRFKPSIAVLTLGFGALRASNLVEIARGPLEELAEKSGETVNLGVLVGGRVIYTHRILKRSLDTAAVHVGTPLPTPCNSIGKLLLATLDDDTLRQLEPEMDFAPCQGPRAPASLAELIDELGTIRAKGWALQDQEVAWGVRSVAAPVRDENGGIPAGISVPVQSSQWSATQLVKRFLPLALDTAQEISARLGFSGPWPDEIVPTAPPASTRAAE
jgi:IclR family pca regulon transcriptional regulator